MVWRPKGHRSDGRAPSPAAPRRHRLELGARAPALLPAPRDRPSLTQRAPAPPAPAARAAVGGPSRHRLHPVASTAPHRLSRLPHRGGEPCVSLPAAAPDGGAPPPTTGARVPSTSPRRKSRPRALVTPRRTTSTGHPAL